MNIEDGRWDVRPAATERWLKEDGKRKMCWALDVYGIVVD